MLKRFLIPTFILGLAIPLFPQKPQKLDKFRQRPAVRLGAMKRALNLTPDQLNTFKATVQGNKAQRQAINQDVRQKAEALRGLMAQPNPNPTEVGDAVLALKQARARGQELREQTLNSFKNSLTPDQLKRLDELKSSRPMRRKGIL